MFHGNECLENCCKGDLVVDEGVVEGSRGTYVKDEVIGYMLVYVDDAMVSGTTPLIERVFEIYKSMCDVKVTGILVADDATTEHTVSEIRFLGCSVKRKDKGYTVDQIAYIEERLLERGYGKVSGKKNLPDPQEGK